MGLNKSVFARESLVATSTVGHVVSYMYARGNQNVLWTIRCPRPPATPPETTASMPASIVWLLGTSGRQCSWQSSHVRASANILDTVLDPTIRRHGLCGRPDSRMLSDLSPISTLRSSNVLGSQQAETHTQSPYRVYNVPPVCGEL
jgi:hypothetical protein